MAHHHRPWRHPPLSPKPPSPIARSDRISSFAILVENVCNLGDLPSSPRKLILHLNEKTQISIESASISKKFESSYLWLSVNSEEDRDELIRRDWSDLLKPQPGKELDAREATPKSSNANKIIFLKNIPARWDADDLHSLLTSSGISLDHERETPIILFNSRYPLSNFNAKAYLDSHDSYLKAVSVPFLKDPVSKSSIKIEKYISQPLKTSFVTVAIRLDTPYLPALGGMNQNYAVTARNLSMISKIMNVALKNAQVAPSLTP